MYVYDTCLYASDGACSRRPKKQKIHYEESEVWQQYKCYRLVSLLFKFLMISLALFAGFRTATFHWNCPLGICFNCLTRNGTLVFDSGCRIKHLQDQEAGRTFAAQTIVIRLGVSKLFILLGFLHTKLLSTIILIAEEENLLCRPHVPYLVITLDFKLFFGQHYRQIFVWENRGHSAKKCVAHDYRSIRILCNAQIYQKLLYLAFSQHVWALIRGMLQGYQSENQLFKHLGKYNCIQTELNTPYTSMQIYGMALHNGQEKHHYICWRVQYLIAKYSDVGNPSFSIIGHS